MKFFSKLFLSTLIFLSYSSVMMAQSSSSSTGQVSDRIVAIVNDRIVLKSDVDNEVANFLRQAEIEGSDLTFSEDLWYSALQSMVDNYVLLEKAEIDSVVVSDDMVSRQMDERINQLIRQAGSEQALEEAFGQSLIQIRADFREQFREQLVAQMVQQQKMSKISITRPEVEEFFNQIPEDSRPVIPEQVTVSQIVVIPDPLEDAREEAFAKAQALRDSITTYGKDFEEMARLYSDDATSQRGGLIPMMPLDDLVSNYSAAASALEPGGISEVVRTEFGYHVIRLNRRSGDSIETNHILIRIDQGQIDEQAAIDKLEAIRDSVMNHGKSFADMARRHSDDEETRMTGGRIVNPQTGERMMQMSNLDPALYRIVLLLDEEGQISEPRSYTPRGRSSDRRAYRIVRLDRHIPEHRANLKDDYDRIREIALNQKRQERMAKWIDEIRDEVYIEFKISMPDDIEYEMPIEEELPASL
ncbi:MAG: peptidylprolyl isomerase [Balneolaceae bacterium]|nr:peptidylprolyl isomerase [Balneolaceae bacterium]